LLLNKYRGGYDGHSLQQLTSNKLIDVITLWQINV